MRTLILVAAFLVIGMAAFAAETTLPPTTTQTVPTTTLCDDLKTEGATEQELAQQGCCSWHNGICGCSGGRIVCCDNTLSPSCGC